MFEEEVDRRRTGGSPSSDMVGVVLKAQRIHCVADCHAALIGRA